VNVNWRLVYQVIYRVYLEVLKNVFGVVERVNWRLIYRVIYQLVYQLIYQVVYRLIYHTVVYRVIYRLVYQIVVYRVIYQVIYQTVFYRVKEILPDVDWMSVMSPSSTLALRSHHSLLPPTHPQIQESCAIVKTTARCTLYMSTSHVSSQKRTRVKLNRIFFVRF